MVRTQIQLTDEQYASLKKLAEERKVPMAELVRMSVDHLLRSSVWVSDEERRRRALDVVGRFNSGRGDLSEKHDDYFVEAVES